MWGIMAKQLVELTEDLLHDIEDAVASGADTNRKIADALGWTEKTFENYLYGYGTRGKYKGEFQGAIKKGKSRCRKTHLRLAENTLGQRLTFHEVEEVEQEKWVDGNGVERQKMKKKKRVVPPSDMLIAFTLVNSAPERWQSINKVETVNHINNIESKRPLNITFTKPRDDA